MNTIQSGTDEHGGPVELYFEDVGDGKPVVLIHGWPVTQAMWAHQALVLAENGYRVVSYDRRGFGRSSKPWSGYDYDTLADDLKAVLDALQLDDVALVGFSMGGGEVARYMRRHGGARVAKVAFISAVTPYLLKTPDNPDGVDADVFNGMIQKIREDRADFFESFGKSFYGVGAVHHPVSSATLDWNQSLVMQASLKATLDCVHAFSETDFREDLQTIKVPSLVVHGDADKTVPIDASGKRTAAMLPRATFRIYDGAPHGLFLTEKDRLNQDLLDFLAA